MGREPRDGWHIWSPSPNLVSFCAFDRCFSFGSPLHGLGMLKDDGWDAMWPFRRYPPLCAIILVCGRPSCAIVKVRLCLFEYKNCMCDSGPVSCECRGFSVWSRAINTVVTWSRKSHHHLNLFIAWLCIFLIWARIRGGTKTNERTNLPAPRLLPRGAVFSPFAPPAHPFASPLVRWPIYRESHSARGPVSFPRAAAPPIIPYI